tara:strand:+ start:736 stop:1629 length:894 start_codon:yes stop_codon:yes gene_type:complete
VTRYPRVKKTSQIVSLFQKVATTNHYEVFFSGFGAMTKLRGHISSRAPLVNNWFITRDLGLLCSAAELPATSFGTAQIEGNRMGVVEKMAHTRIFTDTSMTFYCDMDYRVVQFFELWQDFIASGGEVGRQSGINRKIEKGYYYRMQYPQEYKVDTIRIQKFNKDHFRNIEYTFLNAWPVNVTSMPVAYNGNRVLECTVTFAYDRYYFGAIDSRSRSMVGSNLQNDGTVGTTVETGVGGFADQTGANLNETTIYKLDGLEKTGFTLTQDDLDKAKADRAIKDNSVGDFPTKSFINDIA